MGKSSILSSYLLRPSRDSDLDDLEDLAHQAQTGLTTLPKDRDNLRKRLQRSTEAFENEGLLAPHDELYLFVLENVELQKVVGICGIMSRVGIHEPLYSYCLERQKSIEEAIPPRNSLDILHLRAVHHGPSEVCTLFLHPEHRRGGIGRFLSLSRFVFMAQFGQRFEPWVIAEMRGVSDEEGNSPFWDALGNKFFPIDFATADLMAARSKHFIRDLMPRYPIYVGLLPRSAQEVIGVPHESTMPAQRLLEQQGFTFCGDVDIFDGGPKLSAPRANIASVKNSREGFVERILDEDSEASPHIVGSQKLDFRACAGGITVDEEGAVGISLRMAEQLGLSRGDPVRVVPLFQTDQRSGGKKNHDSAMDQGSVDQGAGSRLS